MLRPPTVDELLPRLAYSQATRLAVRKDAMAVLSKFSSLLPRADLYLSGNSEIPLLVLGGTVPIVYHGHTYNIPVEIWLPETYGPSPPSIKVVPTPEMRIKARHPYVDSHGTVYHPYLSSWQANTHNLLDLIHFVITAFSDEPPVFKYSPDKPANAPGPQIVSQSPPVNHPGGGGFVVQLPQGGGVNPIQFNNIGGGKAIVQPQHPQPQPQPYPYQAFQQPQPQPQPLQPPPQPQPARPPSNHGARGGSVGAIPQVAPNPVAALKDELITKATLKIQAALRDMQSQITADLKSLQESYDKMQEGEATITRGVAALKREKEVLQTGIETLDARASELETFLADNADILEGGALDADKYVVTNDIWSRQALEAVAADHAIDDLYGKLMQALEDKAIDLPTYLKLVRRFAREQFSSRALAIRIEGEQRKLEESYRGGK